MLSKEIRDQLDQHRRPSLWWKPLRQLRRLYTLKHGEFTSYVGERPDGSLELVRVGAGEVALELLLNEANVVQSVRHPGLVELAWSARTGEEELTLAFAWRPAFELSYPVDLRWLLRSFVALARAVAALHDSGLVHADLKIEAVHWAEDPDELMLWDLRMAQEPGPRRFEAFSARFAAPEQVAGGDIDVRADVYALGVMLYSMFIRNRFPSILMPATRGMGKPQVDTTRQPFQGITEAPRLSAATAIPAFDAGAFEAGRAESGTQAVLGAKIFFAHQLERVIARTADIGVARELLGVIERATEHKSVDRFADAGVLAGEIEDLLDSARA